MLTSCPILITVQPTAQNTAQNTAYIRSTGLFEVGLQNGVRQGGGLSPVLFVVYLDGLLEELSESGVGCYWGHLFAGALCYADDLVLLAPCASALRCMLSICQSYADDHGLLFNATKTQLFVFVPVKAIAFFLSSL